MKKIQRSEGINKTEKILAQLCDNTFLKLWVYPNVYKNIGQELCDVLIVFENHIFIFSVKDIKFNIEKDTNTSWQRWKKKAIDKQIEAVNGAERWIKKYPDRVYLDAACKRPFPIKIDTENIHVHKIIVAHGIKEACEKYYAPGATGSLPIMYAGEKLPSISNVFYLKLSRDDIIHVFDSYNLELILNELDTITDLANYFLAKEGAISQSPYIWYGGEEDLLANYLMNFENSSQKHSILPKDFSGSEALIFEAGDWGRFIQTDIYKNKKEVDKVSYFWDELLQKTGQNALNGTLLGNSDLLNGQSAIREMARETRFMRRALSQKFVNFILDFPDEAQDFFRQISSVYIKETQIAYLFLQVKIDTINKESDAKAREIRTHMLYVACGSYKNIMPQVKKIIRNRRKFSKIQ